MKRPAVRFGNVIQIIKDQHYLFILTSNGEIFMTSSFSEPKPIWFEVQTPYLYDWDKDSPDLTKEKFDALENMAPPRPSTEPPADAAPNPAPVEKPLLTPQAREAILRRALAEIGVRFQHEEKVREIIKEAGKATGVSI
jgi:hypothetical protein